MDFKLTDSATMHETYIILAILSPVIAGIPLSIQAWFLLLAARRAGIEHPTFRKCFAATVLSSPVYLVFVYFAGWPVGSAIGILAASAIAVWRLETSPVKAIHASATAFVVGLFVFGTIYWISYFYVVILPGIN